MYLHIPILVDCTMVHNNLPHFGHGEPLKDLFNSPPKIPPDLIKIIVLFNGLATVGLGYSHSGYYHSVGLRMNERSAGYHRSILWAKMGW